MKNNNYKLIIFVLLSCLTIHQNFSQINQNKDTLYFNDNWKETTRENHEFYRLLPLKTIDSLSLIIDYYKNGNMQMQGYAYTNDLERLAGDIFWYTEEGFDHSSYEQAVNPTNKPLPYYHHNNTIWKTVIYKDSVKEGEVKVYNPNNIFITTEKYTNGHVSNDTLYRFHQRHYSNKYIKIFYWLSTGNKAKVIKYDNYKIIEELTYAENGKLIQHLYEKDFRENELLDGIYYQVKTKNNFVVKLETQEFTNIKSKVIKLNNINYIGIKESYNYDVEFIEKNETGDYSKIDYEFIYDEKVPEMSFKIYEDNSEELNFEELKKQSDKVINIKDIKTQSIEGLLTTISAKEWSGSYFEDERYSKDKKVKYKYSFNKFNSDFFSFSEFALKEANNGGFGVSYSNEDDDIKQWRLTDMEYYNINIVMLNNEKPIILLTLNGDLEYYIIPTNDNGLLVNFNKKNIKEQSKVIPNKFTLKEYLKAGDSKELYSIYSKSDKKYIANISNEVLVNEAYDSIQRNYQYIIARNKKGIDIYNLNLDKLPINNIRQAYFDRGNLQILTGNSIKYVDVLGDETKRQEKSYMFCGTVNSTSFTLTKSKEKKSHALEIDYGGMGRVEHYKNILILENLNYRYDLTFLNTTKKDDYDGNSSFVDGYVNRTNLLVVSKGKKKGLFEYDKDVYYDKDLVYDLTHTSYGSTNAVEVLPIIYDEIELKEPFIILEKNNKLGIYPLKNGLKYKSFGELKANFIPYETITGEKGWIDVNTHHEFPNK